MTGHTLREDHLHKMAAPSAFDAVAVNEHLQILNATVAALPEKECTAVKAKFKLGNCPSVRELEELWQCSRQYIHQIAEKGLRRLRTRLKQKGIRHVC